MFGLVALAGLGGGLTAAAIRPLVPWPEEYGLAAKFRWWEEHAHEYDLVFLGSSRVFRAFDPREFEAELALQGLELEAFNFGVGGVRAFEMERMLRALLAQRGPRLRWVLYEGGPMDPRFEPLDDDEASRVVFWHTPGRTQDVLHSVARWPFTESDAQQFQSEHPWVAAACAATGLLELAWKVELARRHAQILAWNVTNYGQGRAILGALVGEELVPNRRPMLSQAELAEGQGYVAIEDSADERNEERAQSLREDPERFAKRMLAVRLGNDAFPEVETLNLPALAAQQEAVRAAGAEIVYVVLPDRVPRPDRRALQRAGKLAHLLDFNRPELWPQFFTLESRYDSAHLSRPAALEFSRALAREFAALVRSDR